METSSTVTVLIIGEDDKNAPLLKHSLDNYNYQMVSLPKNSRDIEGSLKKHKADIALINIDVHIPSESFAQGRALHKKGSTPFIYLSTHANDTLLSKAKSTHPQGYLVQPVSPVNLHTSIQCALYCFKKNQHSNEVVKKLTIEYEDLKKRVFNVRTSENTIKICDCYQFNVQTFTLLYQGEEIKMTKKECMLLSLLLAHLGSTVDFDEIIRFVWGGDYQTHNDVRTLVWRFNKKLPQPMIKNTMGIGYCIE